MKDGAAREADASRFSLRAVVAGVAFAVLALAGARPAAAQSDPKALELADRLMEALGGQAAWDAVHFVRFRFAGFRNHSWDKWTGRHRVEFTNRSGEHWIVIQNLNTRQGRVWKDGQELSGEEATKGVEAGYGTWINDTYWLFMPYKLRDPGVTLEHAGTVSEDGATYDKIALSFDNVGLTPGDRYWVFVNQANHRIEKWEYLLQGREPPPAVRTWEGWEEHGGLWFPTAHRQGNSNTFTRDVETVTEFRPGEFEAP